jgi:hypothetical protein
MNVSGGISGAPLTCNRCYDKPPSQASIVRPERLPMGESSSKDDRNF